MELQVLTIDGKVSGSVGLSPEVFGLEPRADLLHRMVRYQLAKRRSGTRKVKNRSEIRCTTAKAYKQKGTGRARHGSRRAPLFRGGGKAHGPLVRDHSISLQKAVRSLALRHALSSKFKSGELVVIESAFFESAKTKVLIGHFRKFECNSALVVDGAVLQEGFARAVRNIATIDFLPVQGINVYDILRRDRLFLTRSAVEALEARFK
ncbi:MAG: 50S ribosomal protein L4 [Alphaproteobacteria bacterium]|nr:50S ribosomal protein L4 [Alphaproteobacteria bacterium]